MPEQSRTKNRAEPPEDADAIELKEDRAQGDRPRRMLNEKQLLQIVPFSRMTLHRMTKAGRFPKGTYISPNRRFWYEDEIVEWQKAVDEFNPNRGRGRVRANHPDASQS
jgi:predicted DNA-binding transcriptional regulator AlpA